MTHQVSVHYAVQTCDTQSYQSSKRFCGSDRTLLSKKSLRSLINSIIDAVAKYPQSQHHVMIFKDRLTPDLDQWLTRLTETQLGPNITVRLTDIHPRTGIVDSIRLCYQWLDQEGQDLVFQVQDDYLFSESSIFDSIDQFFITHHQAQTQAIIQPFNDITYWAVGYRNRSTPRTLILGNRGYWIQIYDTSCSFMTSHWQFRQHWDLYDRFFDLIPDLGKPDAKLENDSLNYMFTRRGVLGLTPVNTLSHHIQTQPDLYVDWRPIWDSIDENT